MQPEVSLLPQWIAPTGSIRSAANALIDRFTPADAYAALLDEVPLFASFALHAHATGSTTLQVQMKIDGTLVDVPVADTLYDLIGDPRRMAYIDGQTLLVLSPHHETVPLVSGSGYAPSGDWIVANPISGAHPQAPWYVWDGQTWVSGEPGYPLVVSATDAPSAVYAPADYVQRLQTLSLLVDGKAVPFRVEPIWTVLEEWRLRFGLERRAYWTHRHLQLALAARREAETTVHAPWWGIGADLGLLERLLGVSGYTPLPWTDVIDVAVRKGRRQVGSVILDDTPQNTDILYPHVKYWVEGGQIVDEPRTISAIGVTWEEDPVVHRSGQNVVAVECSVRSDVTVCRGLFVYTVSSDTLQLWDSTEGTSSDAMMDVLLW